jgi:predicted SAM-dependent methyltransferase
MPPVPGEERRTYPKVLEPLRPQVRRVRRWTRRVAEEKRAARAAEELELKRVERLRRAQASTGLLLDVGTSSGYLSTGWLGFDLDPDEQTLRLDASQPWPLPDGCARAVRTEHMIEHLSWDEAAFCIREAARVLEPDGLCRICTPDLEGIARIYLERDADLLAVHREHGYSAPTWAHLPNNYLRMWGHKFIFDFDSLRVLLEAAGFEQIERAEFNRSRHELLDGTDSHDPGALAALVLCVDAVNPA